MSTLAAQLCCIVAGVEVDEVRSRNAKTHCRFGTRLGRVERLDENLIADADGAHVAPDPDHVVCSTDGRRRRSRTWAARGATMPNKTKPTKPRFLRGCITWALQVMSRLAGITLRCVQTRLKGIWADEDSIKAAAVEDARQTSSSATTTVNPSAAHSTGGSTSSSSGPQTSSSSVPRTAEAADSAAAAHAASPAQTQAAPRRMCLKPACSRSSNH